MITVNNFVFNSFQVNTFVLSDESNNAIIIDPACENEQEVQTLINYIGENSLTPKAIVNTHGHIDHILGVESIKQHYNIPFYLNTNDSFLIETSLQSAQLFGFNYSTIPTIDKLISENEEIIIGDNSVKALHIPGHSPGSLAFYSKADKFVIVGDVLFSGSIGRTDLPGGNYETLITGIKEKLLTLPTDTVVYSGHGPTTTIGREHDTNPFLV